MAWCDEVAYFILLSCLAHNLGSLVSLPASPECALADHSGLTWTALRGASHHRCGVPKTTLTVDIYGQSPQIPAAWDTGALPLGLLCLGRDGSGSGLRLRCLRFDDHRPIASLCSLNQTTATFCAGSSAQVSPNWLGVVSHCARFGGGTAHCLSQSHLSTPLTPNLGGRIEDGTEGYPQTLGRTSPCTL
jgi:hypothetical protein